MPGLWASRSFDAVDPPVAVLVIDDDEALGTALAAALYAYGCRAYLVEGGMAAFQISQAWTPHVIVLDIEMSDCDGFTVAEAMRGTTRFSSVPIVAHTSLPEDEVIDKGKAVETDAFYRKGAPLHGLFRMIEHLAPSRRN
jgi:CheY-like chemotaxis protein